MSLTIKLYATATPKNYLYKTLGTPASHSCALKSQDCSLMNPVLTLAADVGSLAGFNYAYIQDYGKYYFIASPPTAVGYNRAEIELEEDVLMTYASQILNLSGIVKRSQSNWDMYLVDEKQKQEAYTGVVLKKWGYTFQPDKTALVGVNGGGVFD